MLCVASAEPLVACIVPKISFRLNPVVLVVGGIGFPALVAQVFPKSVIVTGSEHPVGGHITVNNNSNVVGAAEFAP